MNTCFNNNTWVWCTRVQDNSAQCKIQKKTTRPTFSEGLNACYYYLENVPMPK